MSKRQLPLTPPNSPKKARGNVDEANEEDAIIAATTSGQGNQDGAGTGGSATMCGKGIGPTREISIFTRGFILHGSWNASFNSELDFNTSEVPLVLPYLEPRFWLDNIGQVGGNNILLTEAISAFGWGVDLHKSELYLEVSSVTKVQLQTTGGTVITQYVPENSQPLYIQYHNKTIKEYPVLDTTSAP